MSMKKQKISLWTIFIGLILGIIIANTISYIIDKNNENSQEKYIQIAKNSALIERCINNYKIFNEESLINKKITIVDTDKYGRYLVDIELQYYISSYNAYTEDIARVVLYDVKEDGTSKMYGYSNAMPYIVGGTKGYEKSIEEIKKECNWNKPIK